MWKVNYKSFNSNIDRLRYVYSYCDEWKLNVSFVRDRPNDTSDTHFDKVRRELYSAFERSAPYGIIVRVSNKRTNVYTFPKQHSFDERTNYDIFLKRPPCQKLNERHYIANDNWLTLKYI